MFMFCMSGNSGYQWQGRMKSSFNSLLSLFSNTHHLSERPKATSLKNHVLLVIEKISSSTPWSAANDRPKAPDTQLVLSCVLLPNASILKKFTRFDDGCKFVRLYDPI